MARLGEAYVRVRADLKDFDADLDKTLKASAAKFEKAFNTALGRRLGKGVAAGISDELDASLAASTKAFVADFERQSREGGSRGGRAAGQAFDGSFFGALRTLSASVGGLITDGLSGLPPQVRAVLGGIVIAASVPLIAGLTSIITAGIAVSIAGVGIALASQFDVVQEAATAFGQRMRSILVESSRPFIDPILAGFGRLEAFVISIGSRLDNTFGNAARFIEPLTSGLLAFLDQVTLGIDDLVAGSGGLVDTLAEGFVVLGAAVEESLLLLSDLGEDGESALRDIIFATADLLVFTTRLLVGITRIYRAIRDLAQSTTAFGIAAKILIPPLALLKLGFDNVDESTGRAREGLNDYNNSTGAYARAGLGALTATKAQTKALKEQADALDETRQAQFRGIDSTLDYLDSLDDLTKTLKENKGAFDTQSRGGREGIAAVSRALQDAETRARNLFIERRLTHEQAQQLFSQEREEIYRNAAAWGVTRERIDAIFGAISSVIALPPIDDKFAALTEGISSAEQAARELRIEINRGGFTPPSFDIGEPASVPGYANGTISDVAHMAMISEGNRREVVLPLTNPSRTRELAQQSGLMNILGGDGASTILVYVGNEQLDSRMYRVANRNSRSQARVMSQGPRMN
jgi:hypothetical protein